MMNNTRYTILAAVALAATAATAQNVADGARFGTTDLGGTARYRSMAGAFGALGGDPSAMSDNPAGIGIYRGTSEFTFTPRLDFNHTETEGTERWKEKKSDLSVGNMSYIISFKTEDARSLVNFNIGLGFNHNVGIDRRYSSMLDYPLSSFGAYVANQTNNALVYNNLSPSYLDTEAAWDDAGMPLLGLMGRYAGTLDDHDDYVYSFDQWPTGAMPTTPTAGSAITSQQRMYVRERNRSDEYNINVAGNWSDFVYGGLTLSIVDFNSTIETEFSEDYFVGNDNSVVAHNDYTNALETKGAGVNVKLGVIYKPLDAWRIGVAVHTPTWFDMKDIYYGTFYYGLGTSVADEGDATSGEYEAKYRYYSPWEYQLSTAYVFGTRALVSLEYDMRDYTSMKYKEERDAWHGADYSYMNELIDTYMAPQHTIKVGAEYRAMPQLSLRLGYLWKSSPFQDELFDANIGRSALWTDTQTGDIAAYVDDNDLMLASPTKPNYSLLDDQHYVTAGIGWRGNGWYIDLACVNRFVNERIAAFPTTDAIAIDDQGWYMSGDMARDYAVTADHIKMTTRTLSWDLTIGLKF